MSRQPGRPGIIVCWISAGEDDGHPPWTAARLCEPRGAWTTVCLPIPILGLIGVAALFLQQTHRNRNLITILQRSVIFHVPPPVPPPPPSPRIPSAQSLPPTKSFPPGPASDVPPHASQDQHSASRKDDQDDQRAQHASQEAQGVDARGDCGEEFGEGQGTHCVAVLAGEETRRHWLLV